MFIHFIEINSKIIKFRTIPIEKDSVIIYIDHNHFILFLLNLLIDEKNNDDEDSMKRIWCILLITDLISVIILLRTKTLQELTIHENCTFREILWKQLKEFKHLIIAPIVLVLLGLSRLILIYVLKYMNSINDFIYCFCFTIEIL